MHSVDPPPQGSIITSRRSAFVGRPFALNVCLLLVQAATANADVMKEYRAAYKNKLNYYENQMKTEDLFFSAWKQATLSHSNRISCRLCTSSDGRRRRGRKQRDHVVRHDRGHR